MAIALLVFILPGTTGYSQTAGIDLDRSDSLLASIVADDGFNEVVRINVFYRFLSISGCLTCIFLAFGRPGYVHTLNYGQNPA